MFLQAPVCPQGGWGCLPQCMLGYHPPGADTPWEQAPSRSRHPPPGADTPGADTPQSRHPLEATPKQTPPSRSRHPLEVDMPPLADTPWEQIPPPPQRYGHCCGRYASYWNAFLLHLQKEERTRMHSSRLRTVWPRRGVCLGGVCLGECLPRGCYEFKVL